MGIISEIKSAKELWDKYKIPSVTKKGIRQFYSERSELSEKWWEEFFSNRSKTPKAVTLMGQALSRTFSNKKQSMAMVNWLNNGASFKVLILSPSSTESSQILHVSKHISYKNNYGSGKILEEKIFDTIETLNSNVVSHVSDALKRPLVRYSTVDMPFSLIAIDDDMVVTLYGVEPEGDSQTTFIIRGENTDSYLSFYKEFENIWNNYSKVSPYPDPIMSPYRDQWMEYIRLSNYNYIPPPPPQVTIYPTYYCSETCSYCMYKSERNRDRAPAGIDEMDIDDLLKIIKDLSKFGVNRIEISGGGEPLEYTHFSDLLSGFKAQKKENTNLSFGLLTNGMNIDKYPKEDLLGVFDDYIRVSRFEGVSLSEEQDHNVLNDRWLGNIVGLLEKKRGSHRATTNIGIKYLLSRTNKDTLPFIIESDIENQALDGIGHIRIKSERNIDKSAITKCEQLIYYIFLNNGMLNSHKEISLSLTKTEYPPNFRCWMSPANAVIAPSGEVYICCNYAQDKDSKCIGNAITDEFSDLWKSKKHIDVRKNIRKDNCDKSTYCNCRYAEAQEKLEKIVPFVK